MWAEVFIFNLIITLVVSVQKTDNVDTSLPMSKEERENLKEEARDMFYHAYRAYMENAFPADELMPLSCSGRWRGSHPSRGDIDDTLGNFSLTLVDTLDTLVILGDITEFEHAIKLVISTVSFDSDVVVSVFETNIRVLGGLLSGHILAEYLQQRHGVLNWYSGELLNMAKDLGYRLLPAFNTSTGIPHARVNLRHGLKSQKLEWSRETCTACAGTMVLEMAALSRLTGEPVFEEKAHRAMDELWRLRHRSSDLMGTVLNVHSGVWVRRDSGVGAGIDSYYEYCLKAYILLGDNRYLGRFNKHYSAVMKYISQGPMLLDVHMHRPHTNSRNFMDALLAFWPGLQVLKGDLKPAVETHEMLYQVMQRHNFIPEAFTTDFQVHWGQHPLRPEFLESTYFLHRATGDPHYLHVGKNVLKSLQKYARVPCGYAAVKDVRTGLHEDRMDSFVLAETFKYLFLLFAEPSDLLINLDEFLFTTEAHLLPLSLARSHSNMTVFTVSDAGGLEDGEYSRQCPSSLKLFPESVRRPLHNMVDGVCPRSSPTSHRKLLASQFQSGNEEHMKLVNDMGITVATLADGRVQLLHTFSNAKSVSDAEEGLLFMQEMVELSKSQAAETQPQSIYFMSQDELITLSAGPAHFGRQLRGSDNVSARVGVANPLRACDTLTNPEWLRGRIAIVERGDCMFVEKARRLVLAGAVGGIVVDNTPESSSGASPMFAMSGDGKDDVPIPVVFLFSQDAWKLLQALAYDPSTIITIADHVSDKEQVKAKTDNIQSSTLQQIKGSVHKFLFSSETDTASETEVNGKKHSGKSQSSRSSDLPLVDVAAVTGGGGDVGDSSGGQGMIRISRRDAYFSSEGTAVIPQFYREHLRKLLLEMLAKPQSEKWLKDIAKDNNKDNSYSESDNDDEDDDSNNSNNNNSNNREKDDLVQVGMTSRSRIGLKYPDEL
ncbi:ER degradation enhancer, mannosidase alpha-like 2 isoform X1 [Lycorma delicatula]|uniref:ER degradation enhancer, mannosidase alpha-like 2 isoform X1 n=1 Tax=Lycorma delicatula TaxID=130591 RepID=UPI003F50E1E6